MEVNILTWTVFSPGTGTWRWTYLLELFFSRYWYMEVALLELFFSPGTGTWRRTYLLELFFSPGTGTWRWTYLLELFFSPGTDTWRWTYLLELFFLQVLVHRGGLRNFYGRHGVNVQTENLRSAETDDEALKMLIQSAISIKLGRYKVHTVPHEML